jgi:hypothetical protein
MHLFIVLLRKTKTVFFITLESDPDHRPGSHRSHSYIKTMIPVAQLACQVKKQSKRQKTGIMVRWSISSQVRLEHFNGRGLTVSNSGMVVVVKQVVAFSRQDNAKGKNRLEFRSQIVLAFVDPAGNNMAGYRF